MRHEGDGLSGGLRSQPLDQCNDPFLNLRGRLDGIAHVGGIIDIPVEIGVFRDLVERLALPATEPHFVEGRLGLNGEAVRGRQRGRRLLCPPLGTREYGVQWPVAQRFGGCFSLGNAALVQPDFDATQQTTGLVPVGQAVPEEQETKR